MKSDVIVISNSGDRMDAALAEAQKVSDYTGLSKKGALHLRLLTEEMLGLMRSITGAEEGDFWIEEENGEYRLHLKVDTVIDLDQREELLSASTRKRNEGARGIMGKIRTFFDPLDGIPVFIDPTPGMMGADMSWTMSGYQELIKSRKEDDEEAAQAWDELEKSVISHVADDVKVSIVGRNVEMIIYKTFK